MRKSAERPARRVGVVVLAGMVALVASLAFASVASAHHISASVQLSLPILASLPDEPDLHPVLPTVSASYGGTVPAAFIDTDEIPGQVLYRFDSVIANQGGTLDVFCTDCASISGRAIKQAVWDGGRPDEPTSPIAVPTSGSATITDITASSRSQGAGGWMFYYAPLGHDHWHYDRAAVYELLIPGEAAPRVVSKTDVGFCFFDTYDHQGSIETYFDATGAGNPNVDPEDLILDDEDWCRPGNTSPGPNGPGIVRTGISPGVGDYYAAQLTDQWVDITGVAPGPFTLRATINPDGALIESDTTNNTLEETRTIPGTLATPAGGTVPAGPGGPVTVSGSIVAPEIPIYLAGGTHQDVLGPVPCALRFGDCYAAADPNLLNFAIVTGPANGTATVGASSGLTGTVQYTPNAGFEGEDTFTFAAIDTRGFQSAPATATVTVKDILLNTVTPVISGNPAVGNRLRSDTGTFVPAPDSYRYQWQRCNAAGSSCANIGGATSATYVLRTADKGSTVRVRVIAKRGTKTARGTSAVTAVIAKLAQLPGNVLVRTLFKGTRKADEIRGTRKHDLIKSGRGGDTIKARAGGDIIKAGNGHDLIFAGKGKDVVVAGRGNDDIRTLDKMFDVVNCGPGDDKVLADAIDKIHKSCENVKQR